MTYPDLDAGSGGSTQPVAVGAEAQGVDDVSSVQGVEVFAFVQVPQHGLAILRGRRWSQSKPQRSAPAPTRPFSAPATVKLERFAASQRRYRKMKGRSKKIQRKHIEG